MTTADPTDLTADDNHLGGYDELAIEPAPCTVEALVTHGHLHGIVNTPLGRTVCCAVAVREDSGTDWLDFCLPVGALSELDQRVGGFPFEEGGESAALPWRKPLDDWLATVAGRVYDAARFRLALIGYVVPDGDHTGYHPANA